MNLDAFVVGQVEFPGAAGGSAAPAIGAEVDAVLRVLCACLCSRFAFV